MRRTGIGPGAKSVERRSTFKVPRAAMQRKRRRGLTDEERMAALEFKESTYGEPCAVCRLYRYAPRNLEAHHVVEAQELRRRGASVYDPRNALPLCRDCHERHTNASRRIPLTALTEQNLEFAREALGDAAGYYLERRYSGVSA